MSSFGISRMSLDKITFLIRGTRYDNNKELNLKLLSNNKEVLNCFLREVMFWCT